MTQLLPTRSSGWLWAACGIAVVVAPSLARSQEQSSKLDAVVVSASRTPQDPKTVPSSVSLLPLDELQASQIVDLGAALDQVPGVYVSDTGAKGGQSSVYIRGANSYQTLFVVDGVRMNDRSAAYQNFLAGADLAGIDRIEVLRGPQGTLYGSSAMGGVILVDTAHGCGHPTGVVGLEAGSFGSLSGTASVAGGTGDAGYSASFTTDTTANDRPYNTFRQWSASTRIEDQATESLVVGATYRGQHGVYEEPGSLVFPASGLVNSDNDLVTAYVRLQASPDFRSSLTTAWHRRDYAYASTWGLSRLRNTRYVADWQNVWTPASSVEIVAGANLERSKYLAAGDRTEDRIAAGYLSATFKPLKDLNLTGGLRHDGFESVGGATTGRIGAAYFFAATGTTVRSTYGSGFTAPGSDDRFGVPSWGQRPNPSLRPETSRGWDAGVEQSLLGGSLTLGATYFRTLYRNLFDWQTTDYTTYEGMTVNRARASTDGVELSASAKGPQGLSTRVAYTYLEARDDTSGLRLARRPRHTVDAEIRDQVAKTWILGAGARVVGNRPDSGLTLGGYSTFRVFASHDFGAGLEGKLRVENALDRRYQEVAGYPSLPLGAYGSMEWRF